MWRPARLLARTTFRNCQVAAPLKRHVRAAQLGVLVAFRNCQVAAPLKRRDLGPVPRDRRTLPQLSSCGPIEAVFTLSIVLAKTVLPQLSSCGPIEAVIAQKGDLGYGPFRNCQVAAPLKREFWAAAGRFDVAPSATVKLRPH